MSRRTVLLSTERLEDRLTPAGAIDTSFNPSGSTPGYQTVNFGTVDTARATVIQPDGKIIAVGSMDGGTSDFAITRLNADGSPDLGFGDVVVPEFGIHTGKTTVWFGTNPSSGSEFANAVCLQPDGKIIVAGYSNINGGAATNNANDFAICRLNADGSLDTTFNGTGKQTISFGADDRATAVGLQQPGNQIIVAGSWSGGLSDFAIARLNSDGTLDINFAPGSTLGGGKQNVFFGNDVTSGFDYATSLVIQPDEKIVVAGYSNINGGVATNTATNDFAICRLNANGTLNTTFNGTGKETINFGYDDRANAVALDANNKIVLAGADDGGEADFAITRLNANGGLDTTFGGGDYGAGSGKMNVYFGSSITSGKDYGTGVKVESDGKIVVGGYTNLNSLLVSRFAVARLNADGTLDTTFDNDGKQIIAPEVGAGAYGLDLQTDGRIVLAGVDSGNFAIARIEGDRVSLSVTMDDQETAVYIGERLTYTMTIANGGPDDVIGTHVHVGGQGWSAFGQTFSYERDNGPTVWNALPNETINIPASGVVTYTIHVNVPNTALVSITLTGSASTPAGVYEPDVANNTASDIDNVAPAVTINQASAQADPTNGSIDFTVVFSEPVTGFTAADVSFAGSTLTMMGSLSGSGANYTISLSGMNGTGTVVASIPAGGAVNGAGISNLASTSTDNTVNFDNVAPTVTINQSSGQADPTSVGPITFTVAFSEPVTGFTASDVSFAGSTVGGTLIASVSGSGANYTVSVSGMSGTGTVVASIPTGAAVDGAGNSSLASTSTDNTVSFNNVAPSVTVNQASGQADPTNVGPIAFTVVFSEPVTGFTAADVSFAGSTVGGTLIAGVSGSGATYTVSVSGMSGTGTVVASIPAGAAVDGTGISNLASTSTDNTVSFDTVAPTVTINKASGQPDPTNVSPITFTVVFSEPVTGFSASDVSFAGSTVGGTLNANVSGSGANYTVSVSGMSGTGAVMASIPDGAALDGAGNMSLASTSTDNTVSFNNSAPSVTINQASSQADPTNVSPITFTVVFSEPVTGFMASDVSLAGSTVGGTLIAGVSGSGANYTVTVSGMSGTGTVVASIPAGSAVNGAGTSSLASTSTDNTVSFDNVAPTVTINQLSSQSDPTNTGPIRFGVEFSEPVTEFTYSDVSLAGSTVGGALVAHVFGSGDNYIVTVTGMSGTGTVVPSIPAGAALDGAGNPNLASTSTDNTVVFNHDSATLVASGQTNGSALVYTANASGQYSNSPAATLRPFGSTGGVRVAVGDVDGDGVDDTALVTGPGAPIRFAVISGKDNSTFLITPTAPFAGSEDFTGGGFIAVADLNKDGDAEVIVTPDLSGGPRVTIFSLVNGAPRVAANFFGIDDPNFRGGARTAAGDVNGDGTNDLVVVAGFGGGPRTAIFDGRTVFATPTRLIGDFFALPGSDAVSLRNGVFAAVGDVSGDGKADLIFGGGPGGAPRVFILSGAQVATGDVAGAQANPIANFFVAGNTNDRGGVRLAAVNSDGDARADVAAGSGEGSPSKLRVYLGKNFTSGGEPNTFQDLDPFGTVLSGGVFVG